MAATPEPPFATQLTLTLPAASDHIRFARLLASAVGARQGLDFDAIEDLRIAVSELCTSATLGAPEDAKLTLSYHGDGPCVSIAGRVPFAAASAGLAGPGVLTVQILDAIAAEHSFEIDDTGVSFTLMMSTPE